MGNFCVAQQGYSKFIEPKKKFQFRCRHLTKRPRKFYPQFFSNPNASQLN